MATAAKARFEPYDRCASLQRSDRPIALEGAASRLGKTVRVASDESAAVDCCTAEPCNVLIVDLSSPSLNIAALVNQLKSNRSTATRVIAFGPHVHEERLAAARNAGCDLVISRGQFFGQIDTILNG